MKNKPTIMNITKGVMNLRSKTKSISNPKPIDISVKGQTPDMTVLSEEQKDYENWINIRMASLMY